MGNFTVPPFDYAQDAPSVVGGAARADGMHEEHEEPKNTKTGGSRCGAGGPRKARSSEAMIWKHKHREIKQALVFQDPGLAHHGGRRPPCASPRVVRELRTIRFSRFSCWILVAKAARRRVSQQLVLASASGRGPHG